MKKEKCICCHRVNPDPIGKARAMAEARRTIKRMKRPEDWTISIFHNITWHWNIRCGFINVYRSGGDRHGNDHYWAMMSDIEDATGSPVARIAGVSWGLGVVYTRDPNKAARRVLNQARSFALKVNEIVIKQQNWMGV